MGTHRLTIFVCLRLKNKGYGGPCFPTLEWGHPIGFVVRLRFQRTGYGGPCVPSPKWGTSAVTLCILALKAGRMMAHAPLRLIGDTPAENCLILRFESSGYDGPHIPTIDLGHLR